MRPKVRKTRKNIALKLAIMERGITQRETGERAGITEVRMCCIARGSHQPTDDEKKALARVLRRDKTIPLDAMVATLFHEQEAAAIA